MVLMGARTPPQCNPCLSIARLEPRLPKEAVAHSGTLICRVKTSASRVFLPHGTPFPCIIIVKSTNSLPSNLIVRWTRILWKSFIMPGVVTAWENVLSYVFCSSRVQGQLHNFKTWSLRSRIRLVLDHHRSPLDGVFPLICIRWP